jgi:hypothetical protein
MPNRLLRWAWSAAIGVAAWTSTITGIEADHASGAGAVDCDDPVTSEVAFDQAD